MQKSVTLKVLMSSPDKFISNSLNISFKRGREPIAILNKITYVFENLKLRMKLIWPKPNIQSL